MTNCATETHKLSIDTCIDNLVNKVKKEYPGCDVTMRLTLVDGREVLVWFADTITRTQMNGLYIEENAGFAGPVELIRNAFRDDVCGCTFFVHK